MKNELALKVYDIDYSFIINNYLSPDLWQKTWTLLVYKNTRVTLELRYINVRQPISIQFEIKIQDENTYDTEWISYDIEQSNVNILKKQINGAIRDCINGLEQYYIHQESGYKELCDSRLEEQDKLRKIAEEYLDDNGITLDDVREAYITKYVDDNDKGYIHINNYVAGRKYKCLSGLWLVFYKAIGRNDKYKEIVDSLRYDENFEDKMKEIKEYIKTFDDEESEEYTDWYSSMTDCLEAI